MKTSTAILGCGALFLIGCLVLVIGGCVSGRAFLHFGIGSDLSDYRDEILAMELEDGLAASLVADLEAVRESVSQGHQFGFFEWIEIDDSIAGLLVDGQLDAAELVILEQEIEGMRVTQSLDQDVIE